MAQTIKIKRSTGNSAPTSLANGELAYLHNDSNSKLYIGEPNGSSGDILTIGGKDFVDKANTAHGWGNHASAGYLTNLGSALVDADFTTNGIMKRTSSGNYSIVTDNSANWNTAHGWGNHASAGYLSDISGQDTDDLTEGSTNLYHSSSRAFSAIKTSLTNGTTENITVSFGTDADSSAEVINLLGTSPISVNGTDGLALSATSVLSLPQALSTTSDVTFSSLDINNGDLSFISSSGDDYVASTNNVSWMLDAHSDLDGNGDVETRIITAEDDGFALFNGAPSSSYPIAFGKATKINSNAMINGNAEITGNLTTEGNTSLGNGVLDHTTCSGGITVNGGLTAKGAVTLGDSNDDTVVIKGNLTVEGATTTIESNTIKTGDSTLELNSDLNDVVSPANLAGGLELNIGKHADATGTQRIFPSIFFHGSVVTTGDYANQARGEWKVRLPSGNSSATNGSSMYALLHTGNFTDTDLTIDGGDSF